MSARRDKRIRNITIALPILLLIGLAGVCFSLWQRAALSAPLVAAVKQGNTQRAKALLERGADPDAQEADSKPKSLRDILLQYFDQLRGKKRLQGQTVFQIAAANKRFDLALLMLEKGANVRGAKGETALLYTVEADDPGVMPLIKALLNRGAGMEARDESGRTPLLYAMQSKQFDLARDLVEHGAQVNVTTPDKAGTPLLWAVNASNADMVRLLLARHASITQARDSVGTTALMVAALNCDMDMVRLLLENGADVNEKSVEFKQTALTMAANKGQTEIVRFLLDHGADIHAVEKDGATVLTESIRLGDAELITLLMDRGADLNAHVKGRDTTTALHQAVYWNRPELVSLLLKHGADPRLKNGDGKTAEDLARDANEPDILRILQNTKQSP